MSVKDKVSNFISELQGDGENLFPYLANKDWKPGGTSIILVHTGMSKNQLLQ